jgi:hypothetical protein
MWLWERVGLMCMRPEVTNLQLAGFCSRLPVVGPRGMVVLAQVMSLMELHVDLQTTAGAVVCRTTMRGC